MFSNSPKNGSTLMQLIPQFAHSSKNDFTMTE